MTTDNQQEYRKLGFNLLNECFDNSEGHHLDKTNVIFIPKDIHKLYKHDQTNPETMNQINIIAWTILESGVY